MQAKWIVPVLAAACLSLLLVLLSALLIPGFSMLGEGAPYPVSFGFPVGFYYALSPRRTIFMVFLTAIDFLIWYLPSLAVVLIARRYRAIDLARLHLSDHFRRPPRVKEIRSTVGRPRVKSIQEDQAKPKVLRIDED